MRGMGVWKIAGPVFWLTREPWKCLCSPTALSSQFAISSLICRTLKCSQRLHRERIKNWQLLVAIWVTLKKKKKVWCLRYSLTLSSREICITFEINDSSRLTKQKLHCHKPLNSVKISQENKGILSCMSFISNNNDLKDDRQITLNVFLLCYHLVSTPRSEGLGLIYATLSISE